jgi:hypothetical protein
VAKKMPVEDEELEGQFFFGFSKSAAQSIFPAKLSLDEENRKP